jgi:hypothetical protein
VAAAGIRKGARTAPVRSRKEIKAFERERRQDQVRTEPAAAPDRGFGPAKPALSSRPKPQPQPQAEEADADAATNDGDEDRQQPVGRNRPLRGLAR